MLRGGTRGRNKAKHTLEASQNSLKGCLFKVQVQLTKGRRYKRRKESTGKKVVSSLDFQEDNTGAEKINTAGEVNAASIEVNTASKVNTGSIELNTARLLEQTGTTGEIKDKEKGKLLCSVKKLQRRQRNRSYKKKLALQKL
ncbi:hypothetical protein Tco_1346175 [Tanacetum coccineum]